MEIEKDKVAKIEYTLTDDDGNVLDSSDGRDPLAYLHGNGNLISGLEDALEGKGSGDTVKVSVPPEKGYGLRDESMIQTVDKSLFQGVDNVEPGMAFQASTEEGVQIITVTDVQGDQVTIDANHPLAGKTLHFDVEIKEIRDSSEEEREHGNVHPA